MSSQTKELKKSTIMWTKESVLKAFQSKRELTSEEVRTGARKLFTVKGNGTVMDVRDSFGNLVISADGSGEILRKKIFNTDYLSPSGLQNTTAQDYLRQGSIAEQEGRLQDAADYFNAFLNAVTLSFSVMSNSKYFHGTIGNGDLVSGNLLSVETNNGMLATIDPKTISVREVQASPLTSLNPFSLIGNVSQKTEELMVIPGIIPSEQVQEFEELTEHTLLPA